MPSDWGLSRPPGSATQGWPKRRSLRYIEAVGKPEAFKMDPDLERQLRRQSGGSAEGEKILSRSAQSIRITSVILIGLFGVLFYVHWLIDPYYREFLARRSSLILVVGLIVMTLMFHVGMWIACSPSSSTRAELLRGGALACSEWTAARDRLAKPLFTLGIFLSFTGLLLPYMILVVEALTKLRGF